MAGPSFEFVDHTADIAVRLRAPAISGLFEAGAVALTEAVTDAGMVSASSERSLHLTASELELLLADWLQELLFLFETEGFLVREAKVEIPGLTTKTTKDTTDNTNDLVAGSRRGHLRDRRGLRAEYVLRASVRGETRDPARHPLKLLIKAVTYHGLEITQTPEGYEATVILDV